MNLDIMLRPYGFLAHTDFNVICLPIIWFLSALNYISTFSFLKMFNIVIKISTIGNLKWKKTGNVGETTMISSNDCYITIVRDNRIAIQQTK
jgi:hypothetical protein